MKNKIIILISVLTISNCIYSQHEKYLLSADTVTVNSFESKEYETTSKSLPQINKSKIADKTIWYGKENFIIDTISEIDYWHTLKHSPIDSSFWGNVNVNNLFIVLNNNYNENDISEFLNDIAATIVNRSIRPDIMNFIEISIPSATPEKVLSIIELAKLQDEIKIAEPVAKYVSLACPPNDPQWNNQWGPYSVYTHEAWCYTTGGSSNLIAVIDDAFDYSHPDLTTNIKYGYDYVYNDNNPEPDNYNTQKHGTHVAGIVAARINNNTGIAGMINDTLYVAKVSDSNANLISAAIINALNTISTFTKIKVINMSFGSYAYNATQATACQNNWNNGKLLVAASGNDDTSTIMYPAAYNSVMAVGAIGTDGNNFFISSYSNYGTEQEVTAPGGETQYGYGILSTIPNNNYDSWEGTSMASPMVAGLAGLLFAVNPCMTNTLARQILQQNVFDFGTQGWDQYYGYGIVYAEGAVIDAIPPTPTISANGLLQFCQGNSVTLTASSGGSYLWSNGATTQSILVNTSGAYFVSVCGEISQTVTVTVYPNPSTPTISLVGNTLQSSPGNSYQWYFNGNTIGGATQQTYIPTQTGNYSVKVSNNYGCSSTSSYFYFVATFIDTAIYTPYVKIFPNPNNGLINFEIKSAELKNVILIVCDNLGKTIHVEEYKNIIGTYNGKIDLTNAKKGIYNIQMILEDEIIVKKLIIY